MISIKYTNYKDRKKEIFNGIHFEVSWKYEFSHNCRIIWKKVSFNKFTQYLKKKSGIQ